MRTKRFKTKKRRRAETENAGGNLDLDFFYFVKLELSDVTVSTENGEAQTSPVFTHLHTSQSRCPVGAQLGVNRAVSEQLYYKTFPKSLFLQEIPTSSCLATYMTTTSYPDLDTNSSNLNKLTVASLHFGGLDIIMPGAPPQLQNPNTSISAPLLHPGLDVTRTYTTFSAMLQKPVYQWIVEAPNNSLRDSCKSESAEGWTLNPGVPQISCCWTLNVTFEQFIPSQIKREDHEHITESVQRDVWLHLSHQSNSQGNNFLWHMNSTWQSDTSNTPKPQCVFVP